MNINEYLKRIKCEHIRHGQVSLDNLRLLQASHLQNIPFENFDIHLGRRISLSIEKAYKKVIKSNRGGYCLELNPLFGWLLQQLGYELNYVACFYYSQKIDEYSRKTFHIALIVHINGEKYYVDVGQTKPLRCPIKLCFNKIQTDLLGSYKFTRESRFARSYNRDGSSTLVYILNRLKRKENVYGCHWVPLIKFEYIARELNEFDIMNDYIQNGAHPDLCTKTICAKHNENGMIMLVDWKLIEVSFEHKNEFRKELILSGFQIDNVLKNIFRVFLDV